MKYLDDVKEFDKDWKSLVGILIVVILAIIAG